MKKSKMCVAAVLASMLVLSGCANNGKKKSSSLPVSSASGTQTSSVSPTSASAPSSSAQSSSSVTPTSASSSATRPSSSSSSQEVRTLLSISAIYNGDAISYGGTLNKANFIVTANYSDSTTEPVLEFELDYNSETSEASMSVKVSAMGKETTVSVAVTPISSSISATYLGEPVNYGGELDKKDFEVTAQMTDGSTQPVAEFELDYNSETSEASMSVKVSAMGKETTVSVAVTPIASSISATYLGEPVNYGGELDKADFEVTAQMTDGSTQPVTEFELDYNSITKESSMSVKVTALGQETSVQVGVVAVLQSIEATFLGSSIKYGGVLTAEDFTVMGTYSDDSTSEVTAYNLTYDSFTAEDYMVVRVSVGEIYDDVEIAVEAVALSLSAKYTGTNIKYNGSITKSKVSVTANMSNGSTQSVPTSNYSISYNSKQKAGTYNGTVTGSGAYAGLSTTFEFTIDRDHLPSGYEAVESEISRMVKAMYPAVEDPEYHIDFMFSSSNGVAYFSNSDYKSEKQDLLEMNLEVAALLDSGATPSNVPYVDEYGEMYAEYFLTTSGLEMYITTAIGGDAKIVQVGVFKSTKITTWPTEEIAARVASIDETTATVIPEVSGFMTFEFNDTYVSKYGIHIFNMIMKSDAGEPLTGYLQGLVMDGWIYQAGGAQFSDTQYTCISADGAITIELGYNDTAKSFFIAMYENTLGFPFEDINGLLAALGSTATLDSSTLPSSAGFKAWNIYSSSYYVDVYCNYNEDPSAEYASAFQSAGWTVVTGLKSYYLNGVGAISPDGKVMIEFGVDSYYDTFDFYIYAFTGDLSWNAEKAAALVEKLVPAGSETVLPELSGGSFYDFNFYSTYNVGQIFVDFEDPATAAAGYIETLLGASWTEIDPVTGGRVFVSPAADMKVAVIARESDGQVYLQLESYVAPAAEWPADKLAELTPSGVRETPVAYSGEEVSSFEVNTSGNLAVYMHTSDIAVSSAGYAAACVAAGWTDDTAYAESISVEHVLTSPQGDIVAYVYSFEDDGITTVEFVFHPILTLENLTGFLTRFGYATTGTDTFMATIADDGAMYQEGTSSGYIILRFYIDESHTEAAVTWAEGLGLILYQTDGSANWSFVDSSYREIDIKVMGDGTTRIIVWEP